MKAVVQRVKNTSLRVNDEEISAIDFGLTVFFCAESKDEEKLQEKINFLAKKIVNLRVFEDEQGKMNRSVLDVGGQILSVSQFTLCGDVNHGNRPSFIGAMQAEKANIVYENFCNVLSGYGVTVRKGVFGADMQITQINDGPVTIWYDI